MTEAEDKGKSGGLLGKIKHAADDLKDKAENLKDKVVDKLDKDDDGKVMDDMKDSVTGLVNKVKKKK